MSPYNLGLIPGEPGYDSNVTVATLPRLRRACMTSCSHTDCARTRRDAARPCVICCKPIGTLTPYVIAHESEEDICPSILTHQHCHAMATYPARRVTFTATLPVGCEDVGAEREVVVEAVVLSDEAIDLCDAVIFVEPTLVELEEQFSEYAIDRLREDCEVEATQQARRERERADERAALVGVAAGFR